MKIYPILLLIVSACASMEKNFEKVYPGMTVAELNETMDGGPTLSRKNDDGSESWFYTPKKNKRNKGYCVLVKDGKVERKEQNIRNVEVGVPFFSKSEITNADCAPDGSRSKTTVKQAPFYKQENTKPAEKEGK